MEAPKEFLSIRHAAVRLGLPVQWLIAEARAGRVPSLKAGRRVLVNLQDVSAVLRERAGHDTAPMGVSQ